ncbi:DoxX family protein [Burkholderia gladioli]|uniref:DoxX family protein n=1 Tax=Burkholderia gladioli TaxID=28095 RepID=UPI001641205D|nr:DoxX family protein [Burkholderia gladioli]MDN7718540.1 DoxX family protein [Burkholderia gladioli]
MSRDPHGRKRLPWGRSDPAWVDAILDWPHTWLIARLALTGPYLVGACMKLSDLGQAAREMQHFGLHPALPWALAIIVVEIAGPLMIIAGRFVWFGAGLLAVFTAIANLLANPFWTLAGEARFAATNGFFEHIGLVGGFILAALATEHEQRRARESGSLRGQLR